MSFFLFPPSAIKVSMQSVYFDGSWLSYVRFLSLIFWYIKERVWSNPVLRVLTLEAWISSWTSNQIVSILRDIEQFDIDSQASVYNVAMKWRIKLFYDERIQCLENKHTGIQDFFFISYFKPLWYFFFGMVPLCFNGIDECGFNNWLCYESIDRRCITPPVILNVQLKAQRVTEYPWYNYTVKSIVQDKYSNGKHILLLTLSPGYLNYAINSTIYFLIDFKME